MVRPTSFVWNHFSKENCHGKTIAMCKYCNLKYLSPNATKMQKHVNKCMKRPVSMLPSYVTSEEDSLGNELTVFNLSPAAEIRTESPTSSLSAASIANETSYFDPNSGIVQPSITAYMDSVSSSEVEKLDSAFARAIYSSNCPLSLTDNEYWREFMHRICPAYKIPSRHDLTNHLLDKEYENVQLIVSNKISKADYVTIITDGWNNVRNESIISFVVATPVPMFFKSIEASSSKHTGQFIFEEISKVIEEISAKKVIAVVTDNASNMKCAWRLLQSNYPNLNCIGCSAHGLNLLLSDIAKIETVKVVIARSKEVIKYFKNKTFLLSIFTEKQNLKKGSCASTLKLPSETRWNGILIMFKSLQDGKESLQETALHNSVDRNIRQVLLDNDLFWACIESLITVLQPICDGVTLIESDTATLSDVPHTYQIIQNSLTNLNSTPLQSDEEKIFVLALEERKKMFCQPIHLAAYLIDPRYQDEPLNSVQIQEGVEFLSNFPSKEPNGKVLADFAEFQSKEGLYSNQGIWNSSKYVSPLVWWKGILRCRSLSDVAIQLFSIPPSSAACERIFSAFSRTHTVTRNRLSNERVAKLIAVRTNLILQSKEKLPVEIFASSEFDDE